MSVPSYRLFAHSFFSGPSDFSCARMHLFFFLYLFSFPEHLSEATTDPDLSLEKGHTTDFQEKISKNDKKMRFSIKIVGGLKNTTFICISKNDNLLLKNRI